MQSIGCVLENSFTSNNIKREQIVIQIHKIKNKKEKTSHDKTIACSLCESVCTAPVQFTTEKKLSEQFLLVSHLSLRFEEEKSADSTRACRGELST